MSEKKKAIIGGVVSAAAVVALALGLGLGLGLPKKTTEPGVKVIGSVNSVNDLPLKASYVKKGDAYLVQTDKTEAKDIRLYAASKDAPAVFTDYQSIDQKHWPIPPPTNDLSKGTCAGGKEAKNMCVQARAGEFSGVNTCNASQCTWGYKCPTQKQPVRLQCSYLPGVGTQTYMDCMKNTQCGWQYKCVQGGTSGNSCILAPDGVFTSFDECKGACS